jgi:hypothetical protein
MDEWELYHTYRRLSEKGMVKPLRCPEDDTELITRLGKADSLVLWCPTENRFITPGLELNARVRAVVMEHTDD